MGAPGSGELPRVSIKTFPRMCWVRVGGPSPCRVVEDAWGVPGTRGAPLRAHAPHHASPFSPVQGASSTRWGAPRTPGRPRCSASPWQKDTPSPCSAWMPPMSCFSLAPKVREGARRALPCQQVGTGEWAMWWAPRGCSLLGHPLPSASSPCCPGWLFLPWGGPWGLCWAQGVIHAPWETPPPMGTFVLPQTAAARCGTW